MHRARCNAEVRCEEGSIDRPPHGLDETALQDGACVLRFAKRPEKSQAEPARPASLI
jgi:hypothetical protein